MTSKDFLKPKKFKIKAKSIEFNSEGMSSLEKTKLYKNFISFLNNHFSHTTFKKNLYNHFHLHCGFIAHYNINGFYGEYFLVGARFNKLAFNKPLPQSEYIGYIKVSDDESVNESFYAIYEELNGSTDGLGSFYNTIINNRNWGGYSDYKDIDDAIKNVFFEYIEIFREEIKKAIKAYHSFEKKENITKLKQEKEAVINNANKLLKKANQIENKMQEQKVIQEKLELNNSFISGQASLFDYMEAA